MENQDKIYKQFKDAAENVESNAFPAMDKVWGTIEGKLETKALKTENKTWKKIAVAASILLIGKIGFQFFKNPEEEVILPKETIVSSEIETKTNSDSIYSNQVIVATEPQNPLIKENATEIISENLQSSESVAAEEKISIAIDSVAERNNFALVQKEINKKSAGKIAIRKFDAMSVVHADKEVAESEIATEIVVSQEKAPPLLVIDGKAVKSKTMGYLSPEELESVEYLNDPLYIINGVEYTEEQLFGPNPTSPYYPIEKQKITSTTILKGESATNLYGQKGKKGVVIIATKDKKPSKK